VPTYDALSRFHRDLAKLTRVQRELFDQAVANFVADLCDVRGFLPGLRVKRVAGTTEVWEMTWAPNGRATWQFGPEQRPGERHVIWRRIGTHDIFRAP